MFERLEPHHTSHLQGKSTGRERALKSLGPCLLDQAFGAISLGVWLSGQRQPTSSFNGGNQGGEESKAGFCAPLPCPTLLCPALTLPSSPGHIVGHTVTSVLLAV